MRINNNMLAINTHRQLGGVALSQAKSMEKLSSGYRINRAGDDAAGLAISEKMRAQIRGLTTAAKNAQDGISLVQTAEGALQEVHGMLNRMVELATQSANGTFDDEVDRKNLESELTALKGEIDRVAKSSNFNGIKLLNGDLGDAAAAGKHRNVTVNGAAQADAVIESPASKGNFEITTAFKADNGKYSSWSLKFNDESGAENRIDIRIEKPADKSAVAATEGTITLNGKKLDIWTGTLDFTDASTSAASIKKLLDKVDGFKDTFEINVATAKITFVNKKTGETEANVTEVLESVVVDTEDKIDLKSIVVTATPGRNVKTTVDGTKMKALNAAAVNNADPKVRQAAIDAAILIVDNEKFAFVDAAEIKNADVLKALKENGVSEQNIIANAGAAQPIDADAMRAASDKINDVFGKDTVVAKGQKLTFEVKSAKGSTKGLTLQVGESSESFQKLTVSVNDMSSRGLGITAVSVADQESAAKSISKIRDAINTVSSTRGDLGALQNRLEHTIANLNTTAENITASESRIRDVDMAKEMVELTKFNILQQAAQAMLAQANQAPQGVLQLLR